LLVSSSFRLHDFPARKKLSFANAKQVFPPAKVALKAQALGAIWKLAMTHRSICLPDFPAVSHVRR
jgi:hypothetical protein